MTGVLSCRPPSSSSLSNSATFVHLLLQFRVCASFGPMWLLVASPLLLAGCGSGGGGGSSAAVAPPPVSVRNIAVSPNPSGTTIQFEIMSPDNHDVSLDLEFSEDRGLTYHAASVGGTTEGVSAEATGSTHALVWYPQPDLETLDQADLRLRIVPTDAVTGDVGSSAASEVFLLGDNGPPVAHSVTPPPGTHGGEITIDYTVSDPNGDVVGLRLEYSVGGTTWHNGTATDGEDGWSAVTTETTPTQRSVVWDSQADLPGVVSNDVFVRLTPIDVVDGTPATSAAMSVHLVAPTFERLTVGEIPSTMNGSTSYTDSQGDLVEHVLSTPADDIQLSVAYGTLPTGSAIDVSSLAITANRQLGDVAPGENLASLFAPDADGGAWVIPGSHASGLGLISFHASIRDTYGNISNELELTLRIVPASGGIRPFDVSDAWWLDFESDMFSTSYSGGAVVSITTSANPNGVADFLEDLEILGLRTVSPTDASASANTNLRIRNWVLTETKGRLDELYGREFDGSGSGFHPHLSFSLSSGDTQSSIRIGGDDLGAGFTLGRAQFDYRNASGNNNRSVGLGVFTTNMIQFYVNSSFSFRNRFDPLIPGRGTPAGEDAIDHYVLSESFDRLNPSNTSEQNERYDDIASAIDALARSTAVVLAHEIGHSIGLCANNPPPLGLFGGTTTPTFAGPYTTPYHFDSPGNNIMAAALSFSTSLISTSTGYRFNELNEAYLREWIALEQ